MRGGAFLCIGESRDGPCSSEAHRQVFIRLHVCSPSSSASLFVPLFVPACGIDKRFAEAHEPCGRPRARPHEEARDFAFLGWFICRRQVVPEPFALWVETHRCAMTSRAHRLPALPRRGCQAPRSRARCCPRAARSSICRIFSVNPYVNYPLANAKRPGVRGASWVYLRLSLAVFLGQQLYGYILAKWLCELSRFRCRPTCLSPRFGLWPCLAPAAQ